MGHINFSYQVESAKKVSEIKGLIVFQGLEMMLFVLIICISSCIAAPKGVPLSKISENAPEMEMAAFQAKGIAKHVNTYERNDNDIQQARHLLNHVTDNDIKNRGACACKNPDCCQENEKMKCFLTG